MTRRMKRIDYGKNELQLGNYPILGIIRNGVHVGRPCVELRCGSGYMMTNKELMTKINDEFPLTNTILFCGDDPTLFSNELWSFIKYYKKNSEKQRRFQMMTDGYKYIPKFLYELNYISINVKTPSSGLETAPEFISWCHEDRELVKKTEVFFVVNATPEDISFARYETVKIGTYKRPITLKQGDGWKNFEEFAEQFIPTMKYPIRILPDTGRIHVQV